MPKSDCKTVRFLFAKTNNSAKYYALAIYKIDYSNQQPFMTKNRKMKPLNNLFFAFIVRICRYLFMYYYLIFSMMQKKFISSFVDRNVGIVLLHHDFKGRAKADLRDSQVGVR